MEITDSSTSIDLDADAIDWAGMQPENSSMLMPVIVTDPLASGNVFALTVSGDGVTADGDYAFFPVVNQASEQTGWNAYPATSSDGEQVG